MKNTTQKIVMTAMFSALVCVATMIVKIPSPLKGYINLGDCMVLLAGWLLSPVYGFLAAGIGSALADLFSGYVVYAPVTFLIKGAMAIVAYYLYSLLNKRFSDIPSRIVSATFSEVLMISSYFLFEGVLYGFAPSALNIPANTVQGVAGLVLGVLLIRIFNKNKIKI